MLTKLMHINKVNYRLYLPDNITATKNPSNEGFCFLKLLEFKNNGNLLLKSDQDLKAKMALTWHKQVKGKSAMKRFWL